jgi:HlyD family secretion protein
MFIPAHLAEHTVESLYAGQGRERPWTYRVLLLAVVGTLATLPFINVDVSVRAPGMVRPATERVELRLAAGARIERVLARDNETVEAGQVLLVLSTAELDERLAHNHTLQVEHAALQAGLVSLLTAISAREESVTAVLPADLRQELAQYQVQLGSYHLAENKARGELARYTALADKGIATPQELENARYESDRLRTESHLLTEQVCTRWQARLREESATLAELALEAQRLGEERGGYILRAPARGTLLGFTGWSPGGYVTAGQLLGAVSPADSLVVEARVASRDVGQVRVGQPARLQVDAFPYTEWGTLDGVVTAISGDWVGGGEAANTPPSFKVMVRPAKLQLSLPGGAHAELKKGLTLSARFLVARRSLFQLLYDDASAWLNPHDQRRT